MGLQYSRRPGTKARAFYSPLGDPALSHDHLEAAIPQADGLNIAHQTHTSPYGWDLGVQPLWGETSPTVSHSTHGWPQYMPPDSVGQRTIPCDACNQFCPVIPPMSPHDLWKGIAPTVTAIQATNASTDYAPGNAAGYPGVPSYSCPAPAPSAGYSANGYAFNDPVPRPDNAASYVPTQNSAAHGSAHQGAADWTAQPPPTAPQAPPANLVTFGDLAGRWMRIIQVEPNGYTGAARFVLEIA